MSDSISNTQTIHPPLLMGVNFHSYGSSAYQNRYTPLPPRNYVEDSFKIFADNQITCIRVTIFWESYELDLHQFSEDLNLIGEEADKYGITCIYDNQQWECSSWMGCGIGMPNSIMSTYYEKKIASHASNYNIKKDFWKRWWNRRVKTVDGVDGWDAQLAFLKDIIKLLRYRKSTFGFEVLNEPEVFEMSHYRKVGQYHNYMIKQLRNITNKPLLFCWVLSHEVIDNPILQALTSPTIKDDNIIYDAHLYPPSIYRMMYFKLVSILMGNVPLYIGEFNSGFTGGSTLTQKQCSQYIDRFKRFGTCGWALWRWSYIHDRNIPAFNLAKVTDNRIEPGIFFTYFKNTLKVTK